MALQATLRSHTIPLRKAVLTIDDTTAHITAPHDQAEGLFVWLCNANIHCLLRRGEGIGGLDVIDFGDPAPDKERRIRAAFAAWRREKA